VFDDTLSVQFAKSFTGWMTTKETISARVRSAAVLSARPKPPSRTADWNTLYRVYFQRADLPGKLLVHYDTPNLVRFECKCVYHFRRPPGWTQLQQQSAGFPKDYENRHPSPRVKQALARDSSSCYTFGAGDYDSVSGEEKSTKMSCEEPFGRSHRESHEHQITSGDYCVYVLSNTIAAAQKNSRHWVFKAARLPAETTTQLSSPRLMV
jgi:hypothetical protein